MKPETKLLKPGELSDEMQDYKIIELERYSVQQTEHLKSRQDEIIASLEEIKHYMFETQEKRIDKLDNRISKLEEIHRKQDKEKEKKQAKKEDMRVYMKKTAFQQLTTQILGIIVTLALIYFGLKGGF